MAALAYGLHDEAIVLASTRPDDDPSAVALRARVLMLSGQYRDAETLVAPIAEANPATVAGLEFARLLTRTGRSTEAVEYFQAVIDAAAGSRRGLDFYRGGLASRALGRYRDANAFFRDASEASPSDPAVQTAWAELFLEKYNHADAVQSFREALNLDNQWAPAHLGLALSLANENPPEARASAERALKINPTFVEAHLFLAELELGDRNVDGARASVERALQINPASLESRALVAAMAYLEDRVSDFETEVARVLEINPAYGDIYRIVGSHSARAYRFDEAVALVRRAVELDPNLSPGVFVLQVPPGG